MPKTALNSQYSESEEEIKRLKQKIEENNKNLANTTKVTMSGGMDSVAIMKNLSEEEKKLSEIKKYNEIKDTELVGKEKLLPLLNDLCL